MDLSKIYESLGIEKLDEEKQSEIKQYLDETVELKAKELAEEKLEEEKNNLVEQYEEKFEEYKEDMTSKFSDFVDEIMENELQIPDKVKKYAKLGEKYEPVLEQMKTMLGIDEGAIDDQARSLLKEAREELESYKDKANELKSEVMELKEDAQEMASHIYLRKKCDGMTEAKKERVLRLLEDVKSKDEIDRKFKIVAEDYKGALTEKTMYCKDCDKEVEIDEENEDAVCPECGGTLVEKKGEKGKTNEELDKSTNQSQTQKDPMMESWVQMLRDNKF